MPGKFSVRVEARFEAAHYLREYRGISEPLHGHSYKVEADLIARGGGLDQDAIAVDFVSAKRKLEAAGEETRLRLHQRHRAVHGDQPERGKHRRVVCIRTAMRR